MINDHDFQSTLGQFAFWILIAVITMLFVKPEKTNRRISVGECLKPNQNPKFHDGDIARGGKNVE